MKIICPLELTNQPIGLDEDGFARIDRVKTMLTPFLTLRRCHHHHSRAHPTIGNVESKTWADLSVSPACRRDKSGRSSPSFRVSEWRGDGAAHPAVETRNVPDADF